MNVVKKIDVSRPFLSSSPTNGLESMKENWIAKNPYDLLVSCVLVIESCFRPVYS